MKFVKFGIFTLALGMFVASCGNNDAANEETAVDTVVTPVVEEVVVPVVDTTVPAVTDSAAMAPATTPAH